MDLYWVGMGLLQVGYRVIPKWPKRK